MRVAHSRRRFAAAQVQLPPFITGPSGARELWVRRDESTDAQALPDVDLEHGVERRSGKEISCCVGSCCPSAATTFHYRSKRCA